MKRCSRMWWWRRTTTMTTSQAPAPKASKPGAPKVPTSQKTQPDDQLNKALEVLKQKVAYVELQPCGGCCQVAFARTELTELGHR